MGFSNFVEQTYPPVLIQLRAARLATIRGGEPVLLRFYIWCLCFRRRM